MSLKILYKYLDGSLTSDISNTTTVLPIDPTTLATLQADVDFNGGEWTYLQLTNGIYYEEVKVTNASGSLLTVTRGASGSTPQTFAASNTHIHAIVGADAIKDIINANPQPSDTTVSGGGLATVKKTDNNYAVTVTPPTFTGSNGATVTGGWPNYTISYEGVDTGCCGCGGGSGGSGDGGIDTLSINSTSLQGNITGSTLTLTLQTIKLTAGDGVEITGSYPNFTIAATSDSGSGITVAVGTGLTLTGDPETSPTISITNTGVTAGTYAGIAINAQGQITSIPQDFAVISSVTGTDPITASTEDNAVAISVGDADVGVKGVVSLADSSGSFDPEEDTEAVTQKMVAKALDTVKGSLTSDGSYTGESDASYTNIITNSPISVNLLSGESVIVLAEVVMLDGTTPETPVNFACALLNGAGVKYYGNKLMTQSKQSIATVVKGPVTDTIALATTAVPTGASVVGQQLLVISI